MNFAVRVSFVIGILMLFIKTYAYYKTGSQAVLSDAMESVIHVFAVGFAAFSMWLSLKPADKNHPYGHDKIAYFSAGFEGSMIIIAACLIIYESVRKMIEGAQVDNLNEGIIFVLLAVIINAILGFYLLLKGKKYQSIILNANGKHILADCYTSIGVVISLLLVKLTGMIILDQVVALLVALNILWTGGKLFKESVRGLMDQIDPVIEVKIQKYLHTISLEKGIFYHKLRHRISGKKIFIEFDLLFDEELSLKEAHEQACMIENYLIEKFDAPVEVITHLEPRQSHNLIHEKYGIIDRY